jgi:hypothetical protein
MFQKGANMSVVKRQRYENRQESYTHVYLIEIRREADGTYWVWCLEHPEDPWGRGAEHHHLYDTGKLCVREGREIRSQEVAEAFAHWWMQRFSEYCETGTFPMTRGSIRVPDR